jgi:FlaA1/EpsC-like NDP-sugar epimerase
VVVKNKRVGDSVQGPLAALLGLSRARKRLVMLAADALCVPVTMYVALSLKGDSLAAPNLHVAEAMLAAVVVCVPVFVRIGLYRAVIRYMGPRAAFVVAVGVAVSTALLVALAASGVVPGLHIATVVIFASLLLVYVGASRMLLRWLLLANGHGAAHVIIYGAGVGGAELATALAASDECRPVAFVDDNPSLWGTIIAGLEVHSQARLPALLSDTHCRRILLAMPSLSSHRRREILAQLEPLGVHVQTMPSIADLLAGTARVDEVQEISVTDFLGREPVAPVQHLFESSIRGKTVLVTGAGGSIGSELCRQILRLSPSRLLLLEMSELALYGIDRELRVIADREHLSVEITALLGNAHHKYRMREILQSFGVQTIYHAAAYKHVPIVEQNVIEGLYNNVFSTWHTAEAALECKVETFVLVSTDKAVNPTNVMGATKRFAELVLQGLQQRTERTRFCMVRFGNVLESSGSVVPLFRDQIRRGGPVTVTHPNVIRYFMTIPEAAQLVIQAGSMAKGGDVFVLDMGKPIRIVDLARRMIQLSGRTVRDEQYPEGDIEIIYTGLRPAEKLFEELLIGKDVAGTEHPMILRAVEHRLPWQDVHSMLEQLRIAMGRFDCSAARGILERAVMEYQPSGELQDLVWMRRPGGALPTLHGDAKIMDLQAHRAIKAPPPSAGAGVSEP